MQQVRPKKKLGQHFLNDRKTAEAIAGTLSGDGYGTVLEIGPGMGVLTEHLIEKGFDDFWAIEIDNESYYFLKNRFPGTEGIVRGDFLKMDIDAMFPGKLAIIGNFPYNISSQILFRCLEHKDKVIELSGMFQKEVAERICAGPGSRTYGILSVLLQAFYSTEYLFTVEPHLFTPPPKVRSAIIRLRRNGTITLDCDEKLFFKVVKATFNQRRKTLRNSVRSAFQLKNNDCQYFGLRPEQLSVKQFEDLTRWVSENIVS